MARQRSPRFQLQGRPVDGRPGHSNMVWELAARYARPLDDTTVLNVFHRTLDGGVSVLLERPVFHGLAVALVSERGEWSHKDGQTTAHLVWDQTGLETRIRWNGSGRERSMVLDADQLQAVRETMTEMDDRGWIGWRN